jgi:hypothetical protein
LAGLFVRTTIHFPPLTTSRLRARAPFKCLCDKRPPAISDRPLNPSNNVSVKTWRGGATHWLRSRLRATELIPDQKKGLYMTMTASKVYGGEREDRFTGAIESQTSKLPSTAYLGLAIGSMAASATLKIIGRSDWALFVGQWAPAFLLMGVYNKLVKQHGSDAYSQAA